MLQMFLRLMIYKDKLFFWWTHLCSPEQFMVTAFAATSLALSSRSFLNFPELKGNSRVLF